MRASTPAQLAANCCCRCAASEALSAPWKPRGKENDGAVEEEEEEEMAACFDADDDEAVASFLRFLVGREEEDGCSGDSSS